MRQKHLVILAKEPRIGRVKTRLARDVGKLAAWRFYREMLHALPKRLSVDKSWQVWLSISPDHARFRSFSQGPVRYLKQGSGDLGARMIRPAQHLPKGAFIVVGVDIPEIKADYIKKAFKLLGTNDAVFGPAEDGGFWLVGLKRHPVLANPYGKSVSWSQSDTLQACLDNLKGKKVAFVETLSDIDSGDDLRRWREKR
ncbi:conserved hypothetical protein [Candidatus Terasakiella magnetica]|uniref:Glycosyltransferase n=1 Tax=Candidatus Terasakiella magnetica TaxID=1867952 RepID=A0A1C3RJ39_9PROT|nr:TIGR04282 family arsenosugar biosynthesis glycosyltransferase [Candidatus Terasakiella magnetica]SCA57282.1 conserved hypothetical protein [Candidatus Terasakiella magnetica]